jgi:hypothetical protein
MSRIKEKLKEEIEEVFEEREAFINSQVDRNLYGWICPIHKIQIAKGILKCPICEQEAKYKIKMSLPSKKEGVDSGYDNKEKDKIRKYDRERKRKAMLDLEKRKRHYANVAKNQEKERQRKKEHSLIS